MTEYQSSLELAASRLTKWVEGKTLPKQLQEEMDHFLYGIDDREYEVSIGEGMMEWLDRHECAPTDGWLTRADLKFIREGLIATRIAAPVDWTANVISSHPGSRVWFRLNKVAYEYDPDLTWVDS